MKIPLKIRLEYKIQDLWIGAFWQRRENIMDGLTQHLWICVLPCLPIHIWWDVRPPKKEQSDIKSDAD